MKEQHHEYLGINALVAIDLLEKAGWQGKDNLDLAKLLSIFKRGRRRRRLLKSYCSAADRVRDVYIEMPFGIADKYDVRDNNLTAMQHFIVPQGNGFRGYNWDKDTSLNGLEVIGDVIASLFNANVRYDYVATDYGLKPQVMRYSPLSRKLAGKNVEVDDLSFPSLAQMGAFYGDGVAAETGYDRPTRIKAAGWALHFVMDACCAHHITGHLLNGHTDWERRLWNVWENRFIKAETNSGAERERQRMTDAVVGMLTSDLQNKKTVKQVISWNARQTASWLDRDGNRDRALKGKIRKKEAYEICTRAIASSIVALNAMF